MKSELNYLSEKIELIQSEIDCLIRKYGLTSRVDSRIEEKVLLENILNALTISGLK